MSESESKSSESTPLLPTTTTLLSSSSVLSNTSSMSSSSISSSSLNAANKMDNNNKQVTTTINGSNLQTSTSTTTILSSASLASSSKQSQIVIDTSKKMQSKPQLSTTLLSTTASQIQKQQQQQFSISLPNQKNPQQQQQQLLSTPTASTASASVLNNKGINNSTTTTNNNNKIQTPAASSPASTVFGSILKSPNPSHLQPNKVQTLVSNSSTGSPSSSHRTRKEKLICRSVTDSSLSTSMSLTPILMSSSHLEPSSKTSSRASSSSSLSTTDNGGSPPRKSIKKTGGSVPGTPRPYKKKHGAVPVKSIIDPLNRESYDPLNNLPNSGGKNSMGGTNIQESGSSSTTNNHHNINKSGGINSLHGDNINKAHTSSSSYITSTNTTFNNNNNSKNNNTTSSQINQGKPTKRKYRKRTAAELEAPRQKRKYNKKNKQPQPIPPEQYEMDSPETAAAKKKAGRPRKIESPTILSSSPSGLTQQEINQQQLQQILQQQAQHQKQQQLQNQQLNGQPHDSSSSSSTLPKYCDPYEQLRLHLKDKKANSDLPRVFGSPNVMPIFKPGQKPWLLLDQVMNGSDREKEAANRIHAGDLLYDTPTTLPTNGSSSSNTNDNSNVKTQNLNPTASSSTATSNSGSTFNNNLLSKISKKELEVVAVPVDVLGDKLSFFSNEDDKLLFEYLLNQQNKSSIIPPNQPTIANSTAAINLDEIKDKDSANLHASSLDDSIPSQRKSTTPVAQINNQQQIPVQILSSSSSSTTTTSCTLNNNLTSQIHSSILPESSHFIPIQTGYQSASTSSSAIPSNTTTSSSASSFLQPSRFQAPSPSLSTVSGGSNSGRRYSRRRHSRLYPPFEQEHCLYSNHSCPFPQAYGSTYCIKHLAERYSPYYVRCSFFSGQTRRRCPNLQYSQDGKRKFCDEHASLLALHRQKICRKPRPPKTFKDDTSEIKRLIEQSKRPPRSEAVAYLEDLCDYKLQTQCMEYQMETKGPTDVEGSVESLGQFQVEYDSDGGVETGEKYECLKNAGYYTTEEVVRILQSKLCRLRQLYMKEFDYIKFYYLMKRRDYLLGEEKLKIVNTNGPGANTVYTSSPNDLVGCKGATVEQFSQDVLSVKKMNALLNYKKLRGDKALFHHLARTKYEEIKEKEVQEHRNQPVDEEVETDSDEEESKRMSAIDELVSQAKAIGRGSQSQSKKTKDRLCAWHEGKDKCGEKAMPAMKYCLTHVMNDEKQCLFDRCTYLLDKNETCPAIIFKRIDKGRCSLHRRIYIKDLGENGKEEEEARLKLNSTLSKASKEESQTMLEELLAKEVPDVTEFDAIVEDLLTKGLDCSDTEYEYSGSDDDEGLRDVDYGKQPRVVDGPKTRRSRQDSVRSIKSSSSSKPQQQQQSQPTAVGKNVSSKSSKKKKKKKRKDSTTSKKTSSSSKNTTTPTTTVSKKKVKNDKRPKLVVNRKVHHVPTTSTNNSQVKKSSTSLTKDKVKRVHVNSKKKYRKTSTSGQSRRRSRKSSAKPTEVINLVEEDEEAEVQIQKVIEEAEDDDEVNAPEDDQE